MKVKFFDIVINVNDDFNDDYPIDDVVEIEIDSESEDELQHMDEELELVGYLSEELNQNISCYRYEIQGKVYESITELNRIYNN